MIHTSLNLHPTMPVQIPMYTIVLKQNRTTVNMSGRKDMITKLKFITKTL